MPGDLELLIRLGARERARALAVILAMALVGAALEGIGVGLVFPLIALLHDPERLRDSELLWSIHGALGTRSPRQFLVVLALTMGGVFVVKSLYMVWLNHTQARFLTAWRSEASRSLMRAYLMAPFAESVDRNSAGPVRTVASLVPKVFDGFVFSYLQLVVNAIMALAIVLVIGVIEPWAVAVAGLFVPLLALQHRFFRQRSLVLGEGLTRLQRARQKALHEGFGALKEAKILGREGFLLDRFSAADRPFAENRRRQSFLSSLPPILTEAVLMAGVLVVILTVLLSEMESGEVLASLGLLAAGAFRLAPLANRLLMAANSVHYARESTRIVARDLHGGSEPGRVEPAASSPSPAVSDDPTEPTPTRMERELRFEGVCFRYPGADSDALRDIDLSLAAGDSIGLVGPSGAGKSTLADLILGVYEPSAGVIRVDGRPIRGRAAAWRRAVGYVPQDVYLLDDSVRRNVAFGLEEDDARIWTALEQAQVAEAVRELPDGLDARLGEKGARLSAGQSQRIGIARALYPDPSLLVLDEATSALDASTESELTGAIRRLRGSRTLVVVAHRRATLELCDRILVLREGRIEAIRRDLAGQNLAEAVGQ